MAKREFISKTDTGLNLALIAKAKAKSDAQKVLMGRCIFMVDKMPTFTEQDIVKPYLNKISVKLGELIAENIEVDNDGTPIPNQNAYCYQEVLEFIGSLLSEQGDTEND